MFTEFTRRIALNTERADFPAPLYPDVIGDTEYPCEDWTPEELDRWQAEMDAADAARDAARLAALIAANGERDLTDAEHIEIAGLGARVDATHDAAGYPLCQNDDVPF